PPPDLYPLPYTTLFRSLGLDPALLPAAVDDGALDGLDGHRRVGEVERARLLARSRADAAGELGEVVGRVEVGQRPLPVAAVDQVDRKSTRLNSSHVAIS